MTHVPLKKADHSRPGLIKGTDEYLYAFTEADRGINLQSCDLPPKIFLPLSLSNGELPALSLMT